MTRKSLFVPIVLILFALVGVFAFAPAFADAQQRVNLNLNYPSFGGVNLELLDGFTIFHLIRWLYFFVIGIAGIAAFVMILWAGVQWILSAGNTGMISDARDRIKSAMLGLLIIFLSFIVLQFINPAFVDPPQILMDRGIGWDPRCPDPSNCPLPFEGSGGALPAAANGADPEPGPAPDPSPDPEPAPGPEPDPDPIPPPSGIPASAKVINWNSYANGPIYTDSPTGRSQAEQDFGDLRIYVSRGGHFVDNGILHILTRANREEVSLLILPYISPNVDYYGEIRLRFPSNYQWGLADGYNDKKLPLGFAGGTAPTGGICDMDNGWSVRLTGGVAVLTTYEYHAERRFVPQNQCYGARGHVQDIQKGQWYTVRMYVKRNTTGNKDGVLRVWVDGQLRYEKTDVLWSNNTANVSHFMFVHSRGGGGDPPTVDTYYSER